MIPHVRDLEGFQLLYLQIQFQRAGIGLVLGSCARSLELLLELLTLVRWLLSEELSVPLESLGGEPTNSLELLLEALIVVAA